jgi:hypothetical protein
MRVSSVRAIMESSRVEGSADALWLARKEMRRAWLSYVLGGSIVSFLGLTAAVSLSWGLSEFEYFVLRHDRTEEIYSAFLADYLFLLVLAVLGANTLLLKYFTQSWRDTSSSRLGFLSRLPISAGALVGSRALCMLFTLVVGALAFFLPVYFFSDLGEELGMGAYLSFCGVWVGYALFGAGLWQFLEFGVGGRTYALVSYGFALILMILVVLLETTEYTGIVGRVALMAQGGHGMLLASLSILSGGAAFVLLTRATVRRIQNDDSARESLRMSVDA